MAGLTERTVGAGLSRREAEVLDGIARGLIDKEMAARLGITLGTLRVYRRRLQTKLGAKGPVSTMLVAWKRGLLSLDLVAEEALAVADERLSRTRPE